jgi:protein phosphatase
MKVSAKTDIGRNRAENQDNYRSGVMPSGAAWALVCDGMGGGYKGKVAATLAVDAIEDAVYTGLQQEPGKEGMRQMMLEAVRAANAEVYAKSQQEGQVMGTTAVLAVVRENTLYLAHVGDSRAYVYTGGVLEQLTRDHSMVQEMVEQGLISPDEAQHHPEKNVITRALGVDESVEIDFLEHKAPENAILILCTDGLTNMVEPERLERLVAETDFYDMAGVLVDEALAGGGADNITVLLMQFEDGEGEADG